MENNKPDLPEGWSMPDYMAKKISESINRKRITYEDELQDALDEMARDIALIGPNPVDWCSWVIYLLQQLEAEVQRSRKDAFYKESLR
jgi:hypothetical protein